MIKVFLFYALLIFVGIGILIFALVLKRRVDYQHEVITTGFNDHNNTEKYEQDNKGKSRQRLEVELLLISNSPILKTLGMIDRNIRIKLLVIFVLSGIYYLFNLDKSINDIALVLLFILVLTILIPGILTGSILKSKIKSIMVDLPAFIDLVAVSLQTGSGIDGALKQVSADFKTLNPDLSVVMSRIIRKAEISGLSVALTDLAISLPTREVKMFCTTLQQSLNFGSSVYSHLVQLSADIRELQLLTIEEKLGTLAAKMSVPLILFIMFPIIILILAPGAMRVFPNVF